MKPSNWIRRKEWPSTDVYMPNVRGDIKVLSLLDLENLAAKAEVNQWSAVGRPEWLNQHRDEVDHVILVVFGVEHPSVYRCIATVMLKDRSGSSFTLDVSFDDFDSLQHVEPKSLLTMAHRHLLSFPPLNLDPSQEEAWRQLGG